MESISGRDFKGERVVLDGKSFRECRFLSCILVFEGTEVFALADCSVSDDTVFALTDAAQLTLQRIHAMLHSNGWVADIAKNLLEILKTPPGVESPR